MSPALMMNFEKSIKILDENDLNDDIINIDSCNFLTPTIISHLMGFIYHNHKSIKKHDDNSINEYLHKVLGLKEHPDTTFPFRWLDEKSDNSSELTRDILSIMNPIKGLTQALQYIFSELITNVYDHSDFDNGFVIGQYYPRLKSTDYCFMDNGISIPGSFKNSNITFENDCDAIIQSINSKSTKECGGYIERGTGLNTVTNMVTRGGNGNVLIASGEGVVELTKNNIVTKQIPKNYIKGTLVSIRIKSDKAINIYDYLNPHTYEL